MTVRASVHPGSDFWVLARVTQADGTLVARAGASDPDIEVSAWVVNYPERTGRDNNTGPYIFRSVQLTNVTALSTNETEVTLFTALQKDSKWTEDDNGYNFSHYVDVDALKQTVTATTANVYGEVSDAPTIESWSSDNAKLLLEYSITATAFGTVILRAEIQLLPSDTFGQTTL